MVDSTALVEKTKTLKISSKEDAIVPTSPSERKKPTLHMIGLFHTVPSKEWSHCAFTGKVLRFSKMMRMYGFKVIEYSNGVSESEADEKVMILTREELDSYLKESQEKNPNAKFHGDNAVTGSPLHIEFSKRLLPEMLKRVKQGDLVCHPFGAPHQNLVVDLHSCGPIHLESGIGYPNAWCGQRIYESSAWMHWHYGKGEAQAVKDGEEVVKKKNGEIVTNRVPIEWGKNYHFVIPNYFDVDEWDVVPDLSVVENPLAEVLETRIANLKRNKLPVPEGLQKYELGGKGSYVAFLGRIYDGKGVQVIVEIANRMPEEIFILCGQGDPERYIKSAKHHNIIAVEPITGRERSVYLGGAKCALMPTAFIEPFGGSGVESMLCGTPLIAVGYGAFCETVIHGVTGFRCTTLGDWCEAIRKAPSLDRKIVAETTRSRYGLEPVGKMYDAVLQSIGDLAYQGYQSSKSHFI